ncbi:MAG: aminopeptidase [Acidobacteriota bacterium]|nr:aminopeptidase [Acidobacteriota bacterium]
MRRFRPALPELVFLGLAVLGLAGCGVPYTSQAVWGHCRLLMARRSVAKLIASSETDAATRGRLELLSDIRDFASRDLALPENKSFRTYVSLDRPYVLWNVVAAPELSTEPLEWCFPIAGCVSYRGYFSQRRAERFAATLRGRGYDVVAYGVAAYSTLGWFADPASSTFLDWDEAELAELVFHELAHQRLYAAGDTTFNESFASFVAEQGVALWFRATGTEARVSEYARRAGHRERFADLVAGYRARLQAAYDAPRADDWKRARKRELLADLRAAYGRRTGTWADDPLYDGWFAQELDNAHLAAVASYHDLVPAFRALYRRAASSLEAFYEEAEALSRREPAERSAILTTLAGEEPGGPAAAARGGSAGAGGGAAPAQHLPDLRESR